MEEPKIISRRTAVKSSLFGLLVVSIPNIIYAKKIMEAPLNRFSSNKLFHRYPSIDDEIVSEVVGASHFNLDRVKALVNKRPELARATWDWAFGDWETALGGASHVGRRDIARFLMSKGDDLYIGNYLNRKIYRMQKNSNFLEYVATVPDSGTDFPYLAFIAYAKGSLYGTNYGEHKIYKIGTESPNDVEIFSGSTYGNTDGDISVAKFGYPGGIVADKHQNTLYVSQYDGLGNIRKISGIKKDDELVNANEPAEEIRTTTHVFDKMTLPVSVNPNPAKNSITLQSPKDMRAVKIFNINGSLAKELVNLKNRATIDISELNPGLYLVSIVTEDGTITRKFVKN